MNVEATKLELMQLLLQTQKESLLAKIKQLFDEEADWYQEMSSEEKREIEKGMKQADAGEYKSNQDVLKRFDKWH